MIPQAEVSGSSGLSVIIFVLRKLRLSERSELESLSNTGKSKLMYVHWSVIILEQLKVSFSSFHEWGLVYVLQDISAELIGVTAYTKNLLMSPLRLPSFS